MGHNLAKCFILNVPFCCGDSTDLNLRAERKYHIKTLMRSIINRNDSFVYHPQTSRFIGSNDCIKSVWMFWAKSECLMRIKRMWPYEKWPFAWVIMMVGLWPISFDSHEVNQVPLIGFSDSFDEQSAHTECPRRANACNIHWKIS